MTPLNLDEIVPVAVILILIYNHKTAKKVVMEGINQFTDWFEKGWK